MDMPITYYSVGADEDLAREVLVVAADIAPCIASFADDSEQQKNAISILKRVYQDIEGRGARHVRREQAGSVSIEYSVEDAFEGRPTRALRALCAAGTDRGHSVGSFPLERPLSRIWPETYS